MLFWVRSALPLATEGTQECIWNLSYNERRMAIELELTTYLQEEEGLVLCCVIAHCVLGRAKRHSRAGRDSHDHHHCQDHQPISAHYRLLHIFISYTLNCYYYPWLTPAPYQGSSNVHGAKYGIFLLICKG